VPSVRRCRHKSSDRITWAVLFELDDKKTSLPWQTDSKPTTCAR
jgi:hypothetical protein